MGRPCTICSHAHREAINEALAQGYSFRDVAGYYVVSKTALHRHWQAHVPAEPGGAPITAARGSGTPARFSSTWLWWGAGILGVLWAVGRVLEAGISGD